MLPWMKKPVGLGELVREAGGEDPDEAPKRPQTPEDQFQIALQWNAALGGKIVYRDSP